MSASRSAPRLAARCPIGLTFGRTDGSTGPFCSFEDNRLLPRARTRTLPSTVPRAMQIDVIYAALGSGGLNLRVQRGVTPTRKVIFIVAGKLAGKEPGAKLCTAQ